MEIPPFSEALLALFVDRKGELETDAGERLEVSATEFDRERVTATAPRLSVGEGRELSGRINRSGDDALLVRLVIETAAYQSDELARVRLRAVDVVPHPLRRRAARVPAGGTAWLEAVNCQEVVDGDRVDGVMIDVSEQGLAFTTDRLLRPGDRLLFHGRFFSERVDADVRVAVARAADSGGRRLVGCMIVEIDTENLARLRRIVSGEARPAPPTLDLGSLRSAADAGRGGWRGRFHRAS